MKQGRVEREKKVQAIAEKLRDVHSLVVSDYRGLTVEQIQDVRRGIAKHGATLHVQKNRLLKHALRQEGYPDEMMAQMSGPIALAYVSGDANAVLKELYEFAKKEYPIKVKASFIEQTLFDIKASEALSKLPSKEILLAQLLGVMNAPVRNLASCFNEILAQFARVLQSVVDSKE